MLRSITGKRHPVLYLSGSKKRVTYTLDDAHPRGLEIKEHKTQLYALKNVAGDGASRERRRLGFAIQELYDTPQRQAEIDGDAYVAFIRPHLEELAARREEADRLFFNARVEKLAELNEG